jgi:hypothetical protein
VKLRIRWHPAIVLVLCGLPLFGYTAWRVYTGGRVRELTLEVGSDGRVTVTARRQWVTEVRPGFDLPDRVAWLLHRTVTTFAKDADRGPDGLPALPVRIVLPEGASVDDACALIMFAEKNHLRQLVLESAGVSVEVLILKDTFGQLCKRKPLLLADLALPTPDHAEWQMVEVEFREVGSVCVCDWGEGDIELSVASFWKSLLSTMGTRKAEVSFDGPEGRDFTRFHAVGIRWGEAALVSDLLSAIAAIKASDPAPTIILAMPERE